MTSVEGGDKWWSKMGCNKSILIDLSTFPIEYVLVDEACTSSLVGETRFAGH